MAGLIESASAILSASERRLEIIANNVTNLSTPGFKRQVSFTDALSGESAGPLAGMLPHVRPDLAQGRLSETRNPLDLGISGAGFFRLRAGSDIVYSRQGQFRLDEEGRVVTPQGYALQDANGGDLRLDHAEVRIQADGTVLDEDRPVARIALFAPTEEARVEAAGGSLFTIAEGGAEEVTDPQLRQGMIETSNVSLGDEMVAMMTTLRQAENGARLVQLYDDLMGRAITSIGQAG